MQRNTWLGRMVGRKNAKRKSKFLSHPNSLFSLESSRKLRKKIQKQGVNNTIPFLLTLCRWFTCIRQSYGSLGFLNRFFPLNGVTFPPLSHVGVGESTESRWNAGTSVWKRPGEICMASIPVFLPVPWLSRILDPNGWEILKFLVGTH